MSFSNPLLSLLSENKNTQQVIIFVNVLFLDSKWFWNVQHGTRAESLSNSQTTKARRRNQLTARVRSFSSARCRSLSSFNCCRETTSLLCSSVERNICCCSLRFSLSASARISFILSVWASFSDSLFVFSDDICSQRQKRYLGSCVWSWSRLLQRNTDETDNCVTVTFSEWPSWFVQTSSSSCLTLVSQPFFAAAICSSFSWDSRVNSAFFSWFFWELISFRNFSHSVLMKQQKIISSQHVTD